MVGSRVGSKKDVRLQQMGGETWVMAVVFEFLVAFV